MKKDRLVTEQEIEKMNLEEVRALFGSYKKYIGADEWEYNDLIVAMLKRIMEYDPNGVLEEISEGLNACDELAKDKDYLKNDYGYSWEYSFAYEAMNCFVLALGEDEALSILDNHEDFRDRILTRYHHVSGGVFAAAYSHREAAEFGEYVDKIFSNVNFMQFCADDEWENVRNLLDWLSFNLPYNKDSTECLIAKVGNLPNPMRETIRKSLEDTLKEQEEFAEPINITVNLEFEPGEDSLLTGEEAGVYDELFETEDSLFDEYDDEYTDTDEWENSEDDSCDSDDIDEQLISLEDVSGDDWFAEEKDDDFTDFMAITDALMIARGESPLDPSARLRTITDPLGLFSKKEK